jgi:hypothetical protein
MITYTPKTPMEAAVFETGHFELTTDTAGREVLCVGHDRLPKVVLPKKAEGLKDLMKVLGKNGGKAFTVTDADPWQVEPVAARTSALPEAAEEYLVMAVHTLLVEGRPLRVGAGRELVRLFLAPWYIPTIKLALGNTTHLALNTNRNVIGDWVPLEGKRGMLLGVPEVWCSILERQRRPGSTMVYRCDVPMPWVSANGLTNAIPTTVGVYELGEDAGDKSERTGTWVAKLPVFMTDGTAIDPVELPQAVSVAEVPDGPWELEVMSPLQDFDMSELD